MSSVWVAIQNFMGNARSFTLKFFINRKMLNAKLFVFLRLPQMKKMHIILVFWHKFTGYASLLFFSFSVRDYVTLLILYMLIDYSNLRNLGRPSILSFTMSQNCICFFKEEVSVCLSPLLKKCCITIIKF